VDAVKSQYASLERENQDSGVEAIVHHVRGASRREEVKAGHVGQSSAAPVPTPDKWSSEAVTARSKARPWRMEKLKMAGILGEKPDFEFL
jgi:hypothetical protein